MTVSTRRLEKYAEQLLQIHSQPRNTETKIFLLQKLEQVLARLARSSCQKSKKGKKLRKLDKYRERIFFAPTGPAQSINNAH